MHVENKINLILDGRFNSIGDTVNLLYVKVFHLFNVLILSIFIPIFPLIFFWAQFLICFDHL